MPDFSILQFFFFRVTYYNILVHRLFLVDYSIVYGIQVEDVVEAEEDSEAEEVVEAEEKQNKDN